MNTTCLSRGPKRRTLTALGLPVLAAAIVASAPGASAASSHKVTDGDLTWGVKQSFRSYIKGGIANGAAETSGGATTAADGAFVFTKGTGAVSVTDVVEANFSGSVHFTGHEGVLDFTLSNPKIQLDGDGDGQLFVTDSDNVNHTSKKIAIATLSGAKPVIKDGKLAINGSTAKLTAAGVDVFSYQGHGFYPVGQELDPVTVNATLADSGSTTEPTKPTDPTTKPTDPTTKPTDPTTKPTDPTSKPTGSATTQPTTPSGSSTTSTGNGAAPTGTSTSPSGAATAPSGSSNGSNTPAEGPKVNTDRVGQSSGNDGVAALLGGLGVLAAGGGMVWARRSTR